MSVAEITTGKVLLVDDEDALRQRLAQTLDAAGFEVRAVSDGESALDHLISEQFDVLLSKLILPGMDGFAVLRRAREQLPELPVILMADDPSNETSIEADELGALFCLAKPIERSALIHALSSVIRRHRVRRASASSVRRRFVAAWAEVLASTTAKNEFGRIMEMAMHTGPVCITRHRTPRAVLVSIEEYEDLVRSKRSPLDELSSEFDALLAQMQRPEARAAMDAAFNASPELLGQAAVREASRGD